MASVYPVALITILFVPALCSKVEAEGVKVILPAAVLLYAEGSSVVPPTVIAEIAPRHEASSVKVTSKAASTVGEEAGVRVGEGELAILAVIDKSSIARPGLEEPAFVHLKNISLFAATFTIKVADLEVLKDVLFPSVAAPVLVVNDAKSSVVSAIHVPVVRELTVVPT